jgi:hypothetical protein
MFSCISTCRKSSEPLQLHLLQTKTGQQIIKIREKRGDQNKRKQKTEKRESTQLQSLSAISL